MKLQWTHYTLLWTVLALAVINSLAADRRLRRDLNDKDIEDIIPMLGPREQCDLVLLIDRSRGMEMDNFYLREKRLLQRLIRQYATIAEGYVRVAVVTFASDVEITIDSISWGTTNVNKAQLFSGSNPLWDDVQFYYDEDRFVETNMELALQTASLLFQAGRERRAGVKQLLLISTDGDYLRFDDTVAEATQLKSAGVDIFGIGVGPWIAGNAGNVEALVSQTTYYAEYWIWSQMLQLHISNYNYDTTPALGLMEQMPTSGGFCQGACMNNSQCMVDIDTGNETCMCSPGFTRGVDDIGESICRPCPLHTYKSTVGNFPCRVCAQPMYTETRGNVDSSNCICPDDVINAGNEHLDCIDQCIEPTVKCTGVNQVCSYTGTRTWTCGCEDGWSNTLPDWSDNIECTTNIDDCLNNTACGDSGTCVDLDDGFICICANGYEGTDCVTQQDPCDDPICINGGSCASTSSIDFTCTCPYGWGGRYCALVATTPVPETSTTQTPTTQGEGVDTTTASDLEICNAVEIYQTTLVDNNTFIVVNKRDVTENTSLVLFGSGETVRHRKTAAYRITNRDNTPFRPTRICITTNNKRVDFIKYALNGTITTSVKKNPKSQISQICDENIEDDDVGSLLKKVIIKTVLKKSKKLKNYVVSDLLVEGCMPKCGWSSYSNAGVQADNVSADDSINVMESRPNEFPFMAALFKIESEIFTCEGSVIDRNHILTAASCVDGSTKTDWYVHLGKETLDNPGSFEQLFKVEEIRVHEHYVADSHYNDIALLRFETPIKGWTQGIWPICMPQQPLRNIYGDDLTVSGWGSTTFDGPSSNEQFYATGLPAMTFHDCETCVNNFSNEDRILDGMMCAGFCGSNTYETCEGKPGNPLFNKNENGVFEQIGIGSWQYGCAAPGVYSDLYFYKEWIEENAQGATEELFGEGLEPFK